MKMPFNYSIQFLLVPIIMISLYSGLKAQKLDHVLGEVIIEFEDGYDGKYLEDNLRTFQEKRSGISSRKMKTNYRKLQHAYFDHNEINEFEFLEEIRKLEGVKIAQFNHLITYRNIPDDPQFFNQWQYINDGSNGGTEGADIDMDLAWDLTTGGVTLNGDTIVACIIDGGMDPDHQDFGDNLWVNYAEIPDNGFDDDGNGYIDDYHGWNVSGNSSNDNVFSGGSHGTPVAGIIGAQGNNGIGVAGVNWDVKLMIIKGGGNEAEALESYNYPYVMRKRYNESDGEEGAFVVVTNASWGSDLLHWEDAPIWCSFYDSLGAVGILNCGATANKNYDIDVDGDMPTSCPSDFLISVTNMNRNDNKVTSAGYGLETIDLGAFGSETWTTSLGNTYSGFGGTSGATPHVAGAVALAFSMDCQMFADLAISNPSQSALFVKDLILQGVDPNESLDGITVTGGRLNVNNSLLLMDALCSGCAFPLDIVSDSIGGESAIITWGREEPEHEFDVIYKTLISNEWDTIFNAQIPLFIENLETCTDYELRIRTICSDTTSVFGFSYNFTTDGCCKIPDLEDFTIDENEIVFILENILATDTYEFHYKLFGNEEWEMLVQESPIFILPLAGECQTYLYRYRAVCSNGSEFSEENIIDIGCEDCNEYDYCHNGVNNYYEYIDTFRLGDFFLASGSNEGAYGVYDFAKATTLKAGQSYPFELVPGFSGNTYDEYIKIFLDINRDGAFTPNEVIYEIFSDDGEKVIDDVVIPKVISEGYSRLRVMMIFKSFSDPCDQNLNYGEVEDYCVYLDSEISDCRLESPKVFLVDEELDALILNWEYLEGSSEYQYFYREKDSIDWNIGLTTDSLLTIVGLDSCKSYEFQLKAICIDGEGENSEIYEFDTECSTASDDLFQTKRFDFSIFPNPFDDKLQIFVNEEGSSSELTIELLNLDGKIIHRIKAKLSSQNKLISFDPDLIENIEAGIYMIKLIDGQKSSVKKLIKM